MQTPLICPVCDRSLARFENSFKCVQGHSFDIAREGYVNLLLAGKKQPKYLGDAKEMLQARRIFLEREYYQPLAGAIQAQIQPYLAARLEQPQPAYLAELGCGEGYYLGRLKEWLPAAWPLDYYGVDVSKAAIRLAARRYREINFVVADLKGKIPFATGSITLLLNIFAPRNGPEFERVLAQEGRLLVVIPGSHHLLDLPAQLKPLGMEANKRQRLVEQLSSAFRLLDEQRLNYKITLKSEDLANLIWMTPNYRHLAPEQMAGLETAAAIPLTVDFIILAFGKNHSKTF
jgi:23S rRNA (guanine745-N1)-methyltransferase